jgi:muconolactone delta-isomerase
METGQNINKFQVTIAFIMDDTFMNFVPAHRTYINYLINKGIIDTYTVSMETLKSWMVINAPNREDVQELLKRSPLFKYWTYDIDEIFVFDGQGYRLPALQLN